MKRTHLYIFSLILLSLAACVPARQYQDAVDGRNALMQDTATLHMRIAEQNTELAGLHKQIDRLQSEIMVMQSDSLDVHNRYDQMVKANQELRDVEATLNNRINQLLSLSSNENQQLREDLQKKSDELDAKEKQLDAQQQNIDTLNASLLAREKRVKELEDILAKQEQIVTDLKNKIDEALSGFNATDLTVERKNGKVYVSLSEKLLFPSGSTVVDPKGKDALKKLADVLKANPGIQVEIEGHTDNVPLKSANFPKDNWDLSVLRATSIVKILTGDYGVDPKSVTASGRGEYFPVADNTTADGRARNRRTEIILSPDLTPLLQAIGDSTGNNK